MQKPDLTLPELLKAASAFAEIESTHDEPRLFGVTDGKRVGTYIEQKFREVLSAAFTFDLGNSAIGIDFPSLNIDLKVTSIAQPQSSCPFKTARQKIYGLGYSVLIFVYEKSDDPIGKTSCLDILHVIHVDASRTADFQMTSGLRMIVENEGNLDDLIAFMSERNLPADEIEISRLAEEVLANPPELGYLTISNALQWRLQYRRVIELAGTTQGIERIR